MSWMEYNIMRKMRKSVFLEGDFQFMLHQLHGMHQWFRLKEI